MSNNAFAKSISKTASTINFIVDGRSKPGFEVLEGICEVYPSVNPTWLIRGEGNMFIEQKANTIISSAPDQYLQDHVKHLEESFSKLAQQLEVKDRQIEHKDQQIEGLQKTVEVLLGKSDLSENVTRDVIKLNTQLVA